MFVVFAPCFEREAHQLWRHKFQFRQFSDVSTNRSIVRRTKRAICKVEYLGDVLKKSCKTLYYDYLDYHLLFQLKIKLGPISLHLTFKILLAFLKAHLLHLPSNEVQVHPKFPLLIFLAFLKSFHPYLPCNVVRKRPQFPLHQIWSKASQQVIWLRIPHLMREIPSQIIWSLGRVRMWPRPRWKE